MQITAQMQDGTGKPLGTMTLEWPDNVPLPSVGSMLKANLLGQSEPGYAVTAFSPIFDATSGTAQLTGGVMTAIAHRWDANSLFDSINRRSGQAGASVGG